MAKNNSYINMRRELKRFMEDVTPALYSAVVIAMVERNFPDEVIADICARSQEIWKGNRIDPMEMILYAYNRTGIRVMSEKQYEEAVKKGLIEIEENE